MKHQMSQMQQAQNLMLQNLMNNMWPTLPGQMTHHPTPLCLPKLSSPISPNCMFSFLFTLYTYMLNIDRKTNFEMIIVTLQLCSYVYARHFYMRVYLIVRSKSLVSLLLEVTEYPDLEVEYVCIYEKILSTKFA